MASEVDICNLALAHLGDNATVASVSPPEGSAQAEHCARFYPIVRDSLLEMHAWNFATKRIQMALLDSPWSEWNYAYARPTDALRLLSVQPLGVPDDVRAVYESSPGNNVTIDAFGQYVAQQYSAETLADGTAVVFTDQEDAVLRYIARVTDTTKFSPLFVDTLAWQLAASLAGPVLKGDAGSAEAKRCLAMAQVYYSKAVESDTNQRRINPKPVVPWLAGR